MNSFPAEFHHANPQDSSTTIKIGAGFALVCLSLALLFQAPWNVTIALPVLAFAITLFAMLPRSANGYSSCVIDEHGVSLYKDGNLVESIPWLHITAIRQSPLIIVTTDERKIFVNLGWKNHSEAVRTLLSARAKFDPDYQQRCGILYPYPLWFYYLFPKRTGVFVSAFVLLICALCEFLWILLGFSACIFFPLLFALFVKPEAPISTAIRLLFKHSEFTYFAVAFFVGFMICTGKSIFQHAIANKLKRNSPKNLPPQ